MTEQNNEQLVPNRAKAEGKVITSWYRLLLEYEKSKRSKAAEGSSEQAGTDERDDNITNTQESGSIAPPQSWPESSYTCSTAVTE